MIKDLSVGKPSSVLWRFSLPLLLSVVFQQLYSIADSAIAGQFVGESALAAIGASYPITMIFMAIAIGTNIGCSVIISQLFGQKRFADMKTAVNTSFIASAVLSLLLTLLGLLTSTVMLGWLNTPADIFGDTDTYLKIYIGGIFFVFMYNVCTGIFSALGDSRTPLIFLIISSVANIALDILFVTAFRMGVAGVAWATFIAQGAAAVCAFAVMFARLRSIKTEERVRYFSWRMLGRISVTAVPSILQQSFISVGNIIIQGLINKLGTAVVAGYSSAIKLNTFTITSITALANGMSNFTAQNIGAGKIERIKKGYSAGVVMVLICSLVFFIPFFFAPKAMISIFIADASAEAYAAGIDFLRIVSPFYFLISIKLISDGVLRGSSSMFYFMITTFSDLLLRVVLAFVFAPRYGATGIWWSWPIGWILSFILSLIFYFSGVWKPKRLPSENVSEKSSADDSEALG